MKKVCILLVRCTYPLERRYLYFSLPDIVSQQKCIFDETHVCVFLFSLLLEQMFQSSIQMEMQITCGHKHFFSSS